MISKVTILPVLNGPGVIVESVFRSARSYTLGTVVVIVSGSWSSSSPPGSHPVPIALSIITPSFPAFISGVLSQSFPSSLEISARFIIVLGGFALILKVIPTACDHPAGIFAIVRFAILPD